MSVVFHLLRHPRLHPRPLVIFHLRRPHLNPCSPVSSTSSPPSSSHVVRLLPAVEAAPSLLCRASHHPKP
jgi:hypothetical protein